MASSHRSPSPDLTSELTFDLLKKGYSFSFFQAMRLLRLLCRDSSGMESTDTLEFDSIRVRPKLSLAFPAADLDRIEETENKGKTRFQVTANFLGLYGTSSPLPTFYTEDLMDEAADDESVTREFIDVINHRLFQLLYGCLCKYQQSLQLVEFNNTRHAERLFCLMGIGEEKLRSDIFDPCHLLRYVGLFTQMPRSALGLETLLTDALNGMPVTVIPCLERKAKIPDDQKLFVGSPDHFLGRNCFLGEEIIDRMGKFRIRIGPLDKKRFQSFYPEADTYNKVTFLTDMYVLEPLEYDLEIILAEGEAEKVCLGDLDRSRLGLNTWLFSSDQIGEVRTIYTPQRR
ncbi:MAG: type VI secretion system baseplate subunit TssG [Deltaproteobacteria bacterium]|nr:type VI secretion system baseplate subunit TssG [Deltaproteobacteria bacterium]